MKTKFEEISKGDYIAFKFSYNGSHDEIIVDQVSSVHGDKLLCHFLYGHHSLAEFVGKDDVLAIGDHSADTKIHGWSGKFRLLQPNHPLIQKLAS